MDSGASKESMFEQVEQVMQEYEGKDGSFDDLILRMEVTDDRYEEVPCGHGHSVTLGAVAGIGDGPFTPPTSDMPSYIAGTIQANRISHAFYPINAWQLDQPLDLDRVDRGIRASNKFGIANPFDPQQLSIGEAVGRLLVNYSNRDFQHSLLTLPSARSIAQALESLRAIADHEPRAKHMLHLSKMALSRMWLD